MSSREEIAAELAANPTWTARLLIRVLEYNGVNITSVVRDAADGSGTIDLDIPDDISPAFRAHIADLLPLTKLGDEH